MKTLRYTIFLVLGLFLSLPWIQAKQLSPSQAVQRAFKTNVNSRLKNAGRQQLEHVRTITDSLGHNVVHIYQNRLDGRLFFLSADDCAKPLLGYTDGPATLDDTLAGPVGEWMDFYRKQISRGIANKMEYESLPLANPSVAGKSLKRGEQDFPSVPVLLPFEWGTKPFNALCPQVDGVPTLVGCVALAMYQVMGYYAYPTHGRDTVQYITTVEKEERLLETDLNTSVYDWEAMKDLESEEGKAAAAILGRDCAYAVRAKFGLNSTSARTVNVKEALLRYFDYDSTMVMVARSSSSQWFRILYNELANGRPIVYSAQGSYGHAFVCDGFNAADSTFHFNWSWYGKYNGYYSIDALTPGNDVFNEDHMAIVGIQPPGRFVKGTDHVYCYGDLSLRPQAVERDGCKVSFKLNSGSKSDRFGMPGIYFTPPCYPSAQVALVLKETDKPNSEEMLIVANYGQMLKNVAATYDQSLYIPYDCFAMLNTFEFIKYNVDYTVSLAYRDFPDEDFRPVSFPNGGRETAIIRIYPNGQYVCKTEGVAPLLTTNWNQRYINAYSPQRPAGDFYPTGHDATAIGQIIHSLKAPQKVQGDVHYDGLSFDSTDFRFDFSDIQQLVGYIGRAIRTKYAKESQIHSEAAMMGGLHRNLGLTRSQYKNRMFYTTAQWTEMVERQLSMGSPLYYCGKHINGADTARRAFVVDAFTEHRRYHVNFGDGGTGNKYVDLNVINRTGTMPGNSDACYVFDQGMVVDFFSECFVDSTSDKSEPLFMLMEPLVINGNPEIRQIDGADNDEVTVKISLADCQQYDDDYDPERYHLVAIGFPDGEELPIILSEKRVPVSQLEIELPLSLKRASYYGDNELAVYTSTDGLPWERVLDYAPNWMQVNVKGDGCQLTLPFNPTRGARLGMSAQYQLQDAPNKGLVLYLPLANNTSSNYSNYLRIVATSANGEAVVYEGQPVAVYGNTEVGYDIKLPADMVQALSDGAELSAFYKADGGEWLPLFGQTGVEAVPNGSVSDGGVKVFDAMGRQVGDFRANEIQGHYALFLSNLPAGVYVVRENGMARKFVKATK